jgi:hypothetical protein
LHQQQQQQQQASLAWAGLLGASQASSCRHVRLLLLLGASVLESLLVSLPWILTQGLCTTSSSSSSMGCQAAQ